MNRMTTPNRRWGRMNRTDPREGEGKCEKGDEKDIEKYR